MNKLPKALSAKQQEELIGALKDRFEKNLKRHEGLDWAKVQLDWRLIQKNFGLFRKWSAPEVSLMWLDMIKSRANTSFLIVQQKVHQAA